MIKLNRTRMNGDSTSEYILTFCGRMTLLDFIEHIIKNKEDRGVISFGVYDSGTYKSGRIQFVEGDIVDKNIFEKIGDRILSMPCVEGTASGGWGIMDYRVTLTSNYAYQPTEESKKVSGKMSESIKRHEKVCQDLNRLYEKKNHDYGDSFHRLFAEWGFPMVCIRLGDKYNRLCALVKKGDQKVPDESLRDTLMDFANYAIMTIMEIDGEEKK